MPKEELTVSKGILKGVFNNGDYIQMAYDLADGSAKNLAVSVPKTDCYASFIVAARQNGFSQIEVTAGPAGNELDGIRQVSLGKPGDTQLTVYQKALEHG